MTETLTPDIGAFINDIPHDVAQHAHEGTSFVPERRAEGERNSYAQTLADDYARLAKHADTEEKCATLEKEFARYRDGYRKRMLKYLHSRNGLVSWFIAGPARFPVSRMQKKGDIAHRRLGEVLEYRKMVLSVILRKLHPEWRPIMSGDDNAVERLSEKIAEAERLQLVMRNVNKLIRKYAKKGADAQVTAIIEAHPEIGELRARKLLVPDFCGRIGFADFELSNNNANVRRMKQRLDVIGRNKQRPDAKREGQNGVRLEDCPAENRVRLFFPGKPDVETRDKLKGSGFRWTPSLGCWQAYRTALHRAEAFLN